MESQKGKRKMWCSIIHQAETLAFDLGECCETAFQKIASQETIRKNNFSISLFSLLVKNSSTSVDTPLSGPTLSLWVPSWGATDGCFDQQEDIPKYPEFLVSWVPNVWTDSCCILWVWLLYIILHLIRVARLRTEALFIPLTLQHGPVATFHQQLMRKLCYVHLHRLHLS